MSGCHHQIEKDAVLSSERLRAVSLSLVEPGLTIDIRPEQLGLQVSGRDECPHLPTAYLVQSSVLIRVFLSKGILEGKLSLFSFTPNSFFNVIGRIRSDFNAIVVSRTWKDRREYQRIETRKIQHEPIH